MVTILETASVHTALSERVLNFEHFDSPQKSSYAYLYLINVDFKQCVLGLWIKFAVWVKLIKPLYSNQMF